MRIQFFVEILVQNLKFELAHIESVLVIKVAFCHKMLLNGLAMLTPTIKSNKTEVCISHFGHALTSVQSKTW